MQFRQPESLILLVSERNNERIVFELVFRGDWQLEKSTTFGDLFLQLIGICTFVI